MELKTCHHASEFKDRIFPFLRRNEAQNGLVLGIVDTLISRPDTYAKAYLWSLHADGHVVGAAWMTPPHPLGITDMVTEAVGLLVEEAAALADLPKGVVGPKKPANEFCDLWCERFGVGVESTMEQRIYQLSHVSMPYMVPGRMRLADHDDLALLEDWNLNFVRDCRLNDSPAAAKAAAHRAIQNKSRYLWLVGDEPVAMAGTAGATPSGVGINWVYTPAGQRGHGYATAVVAALSQKALSEGRKFCFLYTDQSNPTSNSIYQKIGYLPVCDSVHHTFVGA